MPLSPTEISAKIHEMPSRFVLAASGGGSRAIADLLEQPGASRTILTATIPYSPRAMIEWLGGRIDQFCSPQTARAMAMASFLRACHLEDTNEPPAGIAITASLATNRPKLGGHRIHLALQTEELTHSQSVELQKDHRSRHEEEILSSHMFLNLIAEASGLEDRLELDLLPNEPIETDRVVAPKPWRDLLLGRISLLLRRANDTKPNDTTADAPPLFQPVTNPAGRDLKGKTIFSGAFNPIHIGHRRIVEVAEEKFNRPVEFEISILNVDKPPLDYVEIQNRTSQFGPQQSIWLTRAATFVEKSQLFPGATFLVGVDTVRRIADARYYGDDPVSCQAALDRIASWGCRFLVFGRKIGPSFVKLSHLDLPEPLRSICDEIPVDMFRQDISSTEIRRRERTSVIKRG